MKEYRTIGCVNCIKEKVEGIDGMFDYTCTGNCNGKLDKDALVDKKQSEGVCGINGSGCCGGSPDPEKCNCH